MLAVGHLRFLQQFMDLSILSDQQQRGTLMGKCSFCNKSGFFLSVNSLGYCKSCDNEIGEMCKGNLKTILIYLHDLEDKKRLNTKLELFDSMFDAAKRLMPYENRGVPFGRYWTTDYVAKFVGTFSTPSELLSRLEDYHDQLIMNEVKSVAEKALVKTETMATGKSGSNQLKRALAKMNEIGEQLKYKDLLHPLQEELEKQIHSMPLKDFLLKAEKFEFKGNITKAIDQYLEALFYLKKDDIDDELQAEQITNLEKKIEELKALKG